MLSMVIFVSLSVVSMILFFSGLFLWGVIGWLELMVGWWFSYEAEVAFSPGESIMVGVLFLIYGMVLLFTMLYMDMEKYGWSFNMMVGLFVLGMCIFLTFKDWILILIGWEILGVVSLVLIYYYSNFGSKVSSMVTIVINRVGDIGFIIYLSVAFSGLSVSFFDFYMALMILMCVVSKSAQFPFSVWLPMAMAAPTPVSSLVHSSTLVTAGIFMVLFAYEIMDVNILLVVGLLGVLTVFIAGFSSVVESDVKKIVALSTLFHLGVLSLFLSGSVLACAYLHLYMHGFFKSLLFVSVGVIIFLMSHNQDSRMLWSGAVFWLKVNYAVIVVSVVSLIGVPFSSGSMAKEVLLSWVNDSSLGLFWVFFVYFVLSFSLIYSLKVVKGAMGVGISPSAGVAGVPGLYCMMYVLAVMSVSGWLVVEGWFLNAWQGVVNPASIIIFWVFMVAVAVFSATVNSNSLLSLLGGLYYVFMDSVVWLFIRVFSGLDSSVMMSGLNLIISGFYSVISMWYRWIMFFCLFASGLIMVVLFVLSP